MTWRRPDTAPFRLAGFPWYEQERLFRRLPVVEPGRLPEGVDNLANQTAGGQVAFRSDSTSVAVKVELLGPADMDHMPPTGQCGFDLYIGEPGEQRFCNVVRYDKNLAEYEAVLFEHPDTEKRSFTLNFPLYQGVKRLEIRLAQDAAVEAPAPWSADGSVVIYGTSITQGGCASRPGMAYTNILSRAMNVEFVNLGFSGNGTGGAEVIEFVAAVPNPRLFVLDYEANAGWHENMGKTLPEAVRIIRLQHPEVPILVVSRIAYAMDLTHADQLAEREACRDMQAHLVADHRAQGDTRIHFLDGSSVLGEDFDECTVDGVHPNDLGFMRMARALEPVLRELI